MKRNRLATGCAILAGLSVGQPYHAFAGWSGVMNGLGTGRAGVNVTPYSTGVNTPLATGLIDTPSAALAYDKLSGYDVSAANPTGASFSTYATASGIAGYSWTAGTYAFRGDSTDNTAISEYLLANPTFSILPQAAGSLSLMTSVSPNDPFVLQLSGFASAGTAYMVRGYKWTGPGDPNEADLKTLEELGNPAVGFEPLFTPVFGLGTGPADPSAELGFFYQRVPFPEDLTDPNVQAKTYVVVDGYATATVPESGAYMGLAFGLTALGMAAVRRSKALGSI